MLPMNFYFLPSTSGFQTFDFFGRKKGRPKKCSEKGLGVSNMFLVFFTKKARIRPMQRIL
ncbi:hypothetical protein PsorP6_000089 [Peronosclerospora sorghi]|uniref:Uncharacterized protein n=1 Tax=Peronosclerospora sorghi TaxID=230839 RepID=A0ACC0WSE5_9STRA|nr:hypothetical protein PsorP6_000089 [Peronosclerospora sorghi]